MLWNINNVKRLNYCTTCKLKNTTMDKDHLLEYPKLDHNSKELAKLYLDARRLME